MWWKQLLRHGAGIALLGALSCSNNPYPAADEDMKVLYLPFDTPPKTLDPAISYGTGDTVVTNKVFDTLLEYHYLRRPYELVPSMAEEVPKAEVLAGNQVRYTFHLRPQLSFAADACFGGATAHGRAVTAQDFVFELQRIADPSLSSPVVETFAHLVGFMEFRARLEELAKKDPGFVKKSAKERYAAAGPFAGAVASDTRTLTITLAEPYPQILYWFAMPFTTPVPWEAADYYDGEEGRELLSEHPISTGAFVVSTYDKQARIILERNPTWWGLAPENRSAAVFPTLEGIAEPAEMQQAVGKQLPLLDRIEYRREPEVIPAFSKFQQGYYDMSGISRESFDKVVHEGGLSEEMKAKGMKLNKTVDPGVYYIGFNLEDAVVGVPNKNRARLLRQAMSLAVDVQEYLRLFMNGRGVLAQSPIPPGLFGYDPNYKNPYRSPNLEKARALLKEAGYPGGIDPKTQAPLRLTFDVADTSPEGRVRYMYWVGQWRKIGLNVELSATNYNQFYAKMLKGSYQIYTWGWMADYPDPENFLFLLTTKMARSVSGGPNNANFMNKEYDELFELMRNRENDPERQHLIDEMLKILEQERPWIELFHPESYALVQGWLKNARPAGLSTIATSKYYDLDTEARNRARDKWNHPIYWPAWVLLALIIAVIVPAIVTYRREVS